jgi:hypothetical protein
MRWGDSEAYYVYVRPGFYLDINNNWSSWAGGEIDLSSYKPTSAVTTKRPLLIGLNTSGSLVVYAGSTQNVYANGPAEGQYFDLDYLTDTVIPAATADTFWLGCMPILSIDDDMADAPNRWTALYHISDAISASFADNVFEVYGNVDTTKIVALDVDTNVTTATTRTLKIPDASDTLALTDNTDGAISPLTGGLDVEKTIRAQSNTTTDPASGTGLELHYNSSTDRGHIFAYDRTGAAYKDIQMGTASQLFLDADGQVGIGTTTPSAQNRLHIIHDFNAATALNERGLLSLIDFSIADTGFKSGIQGQAESSHTTGTIDALSGGTFLVRKNAAGVVTWGRGVWARADNANASGTLTNSVSFYANNPVATGTITNAYGLYIANISNGSNNWAIYTNAGKSSFGDDIEHRGATETLIIKDAGSAGATGHRWIELTIGGTTTYIQTQSSK